MGKLGKKARKFARKNLQSVLKRKRKMKSMFKKKNNSNVDTRTRSIRMPKHVASTDYRISSTSNSRCNKSAGKPAGNSCVAYCNWIDHYKSFIWPYQGQQLMTLHDDELQKTFNANWGCFFLGFKMKREKAKRGQRFWRR